MNNISEDKILFEEERVSVPLAILFLIIEATILLRGYSVGMDLNYVLLGLLFLAVYAQFFSMKISVTREELILSFGLGLITFSYPTASLEGLRVDENKQLTSWLYDPTAKEVVSANIRRGKRIYLPCYQPAKFLAALRSR